MSSVSPTSRAATRAHNLRTAAAATLTALIAVTGCSHPGTAPVSTASTSPAAASTASATGAAVNPRTLEIAGDKQAIAAGCGDATCVWLLSTGKIAGRFEAATAVAWSSTNWIALGTADGTIKVVAPDGSVRSTLSGHAPGSGPDGTGISALAFSSTGDLVSVGRDSTVRVWNVDDGSQTAKLDLPTTRGTVAWWDVTRVVIAPGTGPAQLWKIKGTAATPLKGGPAQATGVALEQNGDLLVSGSEDTVRFSNLDDTVTGKALPGGTGGLAASRRGAVAIADPPAGTVSLVTSAKKTVTLTGQDAPEGVTFSVDGATLYTASVRDGIWEWDATTGEKLRVFDMP